MPRPPLNLGDLTAEEKLRLLDDVWESLAPDPSVVPLVDRQRREVDPQLDELDRDGAAGIPRERVLRELEG